ncbi:pectinesterase family protein [Sphingomonas sp. BGYR3]|uniref:pectinesterase family protein n=1 Tax=Sphingomonas sp. BGYR3 TaxID=2975483 RepID=UPI0021A74484|nr:pectinesterase family protein [Sphingomonas sp. BGYR3]MDG5489694.1 pectinesterase family protein [Sphingomonas sp. BGYR3]
MTGRHGIYLTSRRHMLGIAAATLAIGIAPVALAAPDPVARLRVSLSVPGAHRTVAAAIAALPPQGGVIRIDRGLWREKLAITAANVTLVGLGDRPEDTVITWDDSSQKAGGTVRSATLTVSGDRFRMGNLTVRNDWALRPDAYPTQAVALALTGDRAVLDHVRLDGHQDTLFAGKGPGGRLSRHYFGNSRISGHVDFIFGNANAYFSRCALHGNAGSTVMITAHSRNADDDPSAYVFDRCTITADADAGPIWLGRSWRDYARVIFLDTRMDAPVAPGGWREWTPGTTDRLKTSYYAEYRSTGRGAPPPPRVATAHRLSREQAAQWRRDQFFGGDTGWIDEGLMALAQERKVR